MNAAKPGIRRRRTGRSPACALLVAGWACAASATDVFYADGRAVSENGRYQVQARSPDNKFGLWRKPFADNFTYTLTDRHARKTLWTRNQGEQEGSSAALYVDNDGWVAIATGWNNLIFVGPDGRDRGTVNILQDAFTETERRQYVHDTTAGPMWEGYSLWYFVRERERRLFVIRPWWGRRVIVDVERGGLVPEDPDSAAACRAHEQAYVLDELKKAVKTRRNWEKEECCEAIWPILNAAYLAGRLPVADAAPLLEELQDSAYSGSSTFGGLGFGERFEGEVNPHSYETFTLRQVVQLSLRRLGKIPRPFPANQFDVQYENRRQNHPYVPQPPAAPRESQAGAIRAGMKPEQVLDLLGGPDFVGYGTWEYDLDADPPFSLILKWDARQVIEIQQKTPALWKDGFIRDEQILR